MRITTTLTSTEFARLKAKRGINTKFVMPDTSTSFSYRNGATDKVWNEITSQSPRKRGKKQGDTLNNKFYATKTYKQEYGL